MTDISDDELEQRMTAKLFGGTGKRKTSFPHQDARLRSGVGKGLSSLLDQLRVVLGIHGDEQRTSRRGVRFAPFNRPLERQEVTGLPGVRHDISDRIQGDPNGLVEIVIGHGGASGKAGHTTQSMNVTASGGFRAMTKSMKQPPMIPIDGGKRVAA